MLSQDDIQRLRALPIEEVAESLGLHPKGGRCLCPFHNDRHPSLKFNKARNSYRCWACGESGSGPIDLVMKHLHKTFAEACHWLADENNMAMDAGVPLRAPKPPPPPPPLDTGHLESLLAHGSLTPEARRFLYVERRISEQVAGQLGLTGIDHNVPMSRNLHEGWFNAPALLIPYRDVDGRLLSVQARYLGVRAEGSPTPRFQFPKGSRCGIYNLPVLPTLARGEPLYITEGCSDCWAMMTSGHKAIAIPSATLLKGADVERIAHYIRNVAATPPHMCPDRDEPGERLFVELRSVFPDIVRHQLPEGFKDYGQWWAAQKC